MNTTDSFIEYIYNLSNNPLPDRIRDKAKQVLVDYIGVTYAGAFEAGNVLISYIQSSKGICTVLGKDWTTTPVVASFVNGFHAHVMELDDGSRFGMIHLGAVIISAVLAVAEQMSASLDRILYGIIVGYESAVRISMALQPGHKKLGYHTTGTCGTIGAALGCAAVMNMDKYRMKAVLSAAATSAAGLLEIQEDASQMKAYNAGHAAMSGVTAALIGNSGLYGPDNILGGDRGFLAIHSETINLDILTQLTEYYEIERIYVKPYSACRHSHSAIEAILNIRKDLKVAPEDIKEICIYTYQLAIRGHDHQEVKGIQSAKLSMPYSVAAAYMLGSCTMEAFSDESVNDTSILSLAKKVFVYENPEFSLVSSKKRIAEVALATVDGRMIANRVDFAKGDPENPLTKDELSAKFLQLMKWCGMLEMAQSIMEFFSTDKMTSKQLFSILRRNY